MLHTNDLHSHLEQTARIAAYIKSVRSKSDPSSLLVVDCGDFLDRARPETEGTDGAVNRRLMETIGYDAVVLGNNEGLTYTYEQLDRYYSPLTAPVVCANFKSHDPEASLSWLVPSLTVRRSGLKIGLIGLTAAFGAYYDHLGWKASDPLEALRQWTVKLRPEVDVLIVLSHVGLKMDETIAQSIDGIDLILGGHTHHLLESPLRVRNTVLCAAGKFGTHIGHLHIAKDEQTGKINITGGCLSMDDRETDKEAEAVIAAGREQAARRMSRVVARLEEVLPQSLHEESRLPTLLATAIRHRTGAEIGLVNSGQMLGDLPEGDVTEAVVHAICPSPINPCTLRLTGEELLLTLEESLQISFRELEIRGFGFRGKWLGGLCLDGMEVDADLSLPEGSRITGARVNGERLVKEREYIVGTLDMFTFGVGYVRLKNGREPSYFLPEFIRDVLSEALRNKEWIEGSRVRRWNVTNGR
ncbi:bifunctional metallophosphatase/5'-nucleotidase [Cohnella faecalis]|uniref:Bifunctional metallophosphatase/5'-nucleotidase n=1 Tax=Cohnella faecalis TaxID=2315694 RepID=A0A398CWC7_9BACL|nr:bifunctional metallophosphatase/5'-nucleotidase [Cohnella faecalis]